MSTTSLAPRRSRRIVAGLVGALALSTLVIGNPAEAAKPDGSRAQVFLETGDVSANPANAITTGWWGHEGNAAAPSGTGATYLSLDGSDGNGTVNGTSLDALAAAMGTNDLSNVLYAVVPYTADGTNERPTISAGENAAEAFNWILYDGYGSGLSGNTNANDSVRMVSTLSEVSAWYTAGQPVQLFDNSLTLHDATAPGNPVSTAPKGKSILNRWPAGTHLSLVAYVSNGQDADLGNQVPLVEAGPDGKAKTAWMSFTTVAKPGDATRSSAGYVVDGAYAPTVALGHTFNSTGTTATLTGTVKTKANATATDATGKLEFAQVINGERQQATQVDAVNGVASLAISGFTANAVKQYDVRYVPDASAADTYLTSDWLRRTMTGPVVVTAKATTTTLTALGGATDTLTAKVTAGAAGKVTFKDNGKALGAAVTVVGGVAKFKKLLPVGKHTLQAVFTPTNPAAFKTSTGTKTVWQGKLTTVLAPAKGKAKTKPKVTVKVLAPGATVSGKVVITFDPPTGPTKKFTVTLKKGVATLVLPATVKGKTKVSAQYLGNTQILARNGTAVTFTAS